MVLEFNQISNPEERLILKTPAVFVDDVSTCITLMEDIQDTAEKNSTKTLQPN